MSNSYTIFTFYCGDLNWARGPTIGYNAASDYYANHPDTGADDADIIDCTNGPDTYYNVWYNISIENFIPPSPTPPVEPGQLGLLVKLIVLYVTLHATSEIPINYTSCDILEFFSEHLHTLLVLSLY